jgi:hypothetical protein
LDVAPADCIYVGDSVGDFGAAAGAGMVSAGVSWTRRTPESWRHGWPDVAVTTPTRLLEVIDGAGGLGPIGEEIAARHQPTPHRGSIMRLGDRTYGLGRYFPTADRRHPQHPLSRLIIRSKSDEDASEELAACFGAMAEALQHRPDIVVSVPPAPDDRRDRLAQARTRICQASGAADGAGVLTMLFTVSDYKKTARHDRESRNEGRFESEGLDGERVMLIDDVLTSGGQALACRNALLAAGAARVDIVVASVSQDSLLEPCPRCGEEYGGTLKARVRKRDGRPFQGCSRYPSCHYTRDAGP